MENDAGEAILCPVDFSEVSAHALEYAAEISQCRRAPAIVLHTSWWEVPPYFTPARIAELQKEFRSAQRAAAASLRKFVDSVLGPAGADVETRTLEALPADGIRRIAHETGAGLIVMGTHGRSGWNRWTLGSVAERVLQESLVPVLTVRQAPQGPIRNILCPVSNTAESRHALEMASRFGACFEATVTALHVHEPYATAPIPNLCAWIPSEHRAKCHVRELERHGNAAEEIIRTASEGKYDLLVIGAARSRFFEGRVLGGTTVRAVRHAPCPVLSVGAPAVS
jgi:nucleotide-binding universal stress UspA family protein